MFYLGFALFFLLYFIVGAFTELLELTTVGGIIAVAFIFLNIYMYFKSKKTDAD
ncbi:hypothetical protein [Salimicrobium flavidum]|uniref:Uncharacterized protein n=1 Tax=Salimicrobium flavidum TaxID=570947 RepID=A0A1N7J0F0_9BACI|nr:hypothetical protein [Salimicrobium flavidum]SIS42790.1 hypothetical protein SAMN05421687_103107 [Salimicrobium flavidum]